MRLAFSIALMLSTTLSVSTNASGQKVYRCGSSYSSTPCAAAVEVTVDDARSPQQKAETDLNTQRTLKEANAMEAQRQQIEKNASKNSLAAQKSTKNNSAKKQEKTENNETEDKVLKPKKSKHASKKKAPEFFTAKEQGNKK
jgi:hypothetical protein